MTKAIFKHTQVSVTLTLTVVTTRQNQTRLSIIPLAHLTGLFFFLWVMQQRTLQALYAACELATHTGQAIVTTYKLLSIGFNCLTYGMGVTI